VRSRVGSLNEILLADLNLVIKDKIDLYTEDEKLENDSFNKPGFINFFSFNRILPSTKYSQDLQLAIYNSFFSLGINFPRDLVSIILNYNCF
jgi:hypothetical protein